MPELSPFGHAVNGAIGGVIGLTCTYPLDVIKTRMQVQSKSSREYKNVFDAFQKILEHEGVPGLYVGLTSGLLSTLLQQFVYYYWYEFFKPIYQGQSKAPLDTFWQLLLGVHAASFNSITTTPINVINTRIQTASRSQKRSIVGTLKEIVSEDGLLGLWKGVGPALVLSINPAITFLVFEKLKAFFETRARAKDPKAHLSALQFFIIGALAKTVATVMTYPYIMAKTRMQSKQEPVKQDLQTSNQNPQQKAQTGTIDVLINVYKTDGLLGWFAGLETQIAKAVLTQAIQLMAKEKITEYTFKLLAFLALSQKSKST